MERVVEKPVMGEEYDGSNEGKYLSDAPCPRNMGGNADPTWSVKVVIHNMMQGIMGRQQGSFRAYGFVSDAERRHNMGKFLAFCLDVTSFD